MNKKTLTMIIAVISIVVIAGTIIAYMTLSNTQPAVTVTYYNPISFSHVNNSTTTTNFVAVIDYTSSKSKTLLLDYKSFYLTLDGKALQGTFINSNITDSIRTANGLILTSGQKEAWEPTFIVQGNITSYQLAYSSTLNVHIIQANTPCPYSEQELAQMNNQ